MPYDLSWIIIINNKFLSRLFADDFDFLYYYHNNIIDFIFKFQSVLYQLYLSQAPRCFKKLNKKSNQGKEN